MRQERQDLGDDLEGCLARFADAEAADGVAVEVHFDEALGAFATQIAVNTALDDAEEALCSLAEFAMPRDFVPMGAEVIEGAARPVHGEAEAFAGAIAIGRVFGALVESHADVGAESYLHLHGVLGRKEVTAAIQMRTEAHTFIGDLAQLRQAVNLEATGVGEHGVRPTDELMQAAHAADGLVAGAEIEMIGIAEDDLRAEGFEDVLRDGFDGAGCADGHEDRSFDGLVGKMQLRAASAGLSGVENVEG